MKIIANKSTQEKVKIVAEQWRQFRKSKWKETIKQIKVTDIKKKQRKKIAEI